ncbi:MAG: hypothetical protein ACI9G1_004351 [Pirellulaceae bacterium]|jgi:hypothetical protein
MIAECGSKATRNASHPPFFWEGRSGANQIWAPGRVFGVHWTFTCKPVLTEFLHAAKIERDA